MGRTCHSTVFKGTTWQGWSPKPSWLYLLPLWDLSRCDDARLRWQFTFFEGKKKQMTAGEDSFSCIGTSIFESNRSAVSATFFD